MKIIESLKCWLGKHERVEVLSYGINLITLCPRQYVSVCSRCGAVEAFAAGWEVSPKFKDVESAITWADTEKKTLEAFLLRVAKTPPPPSVVRIG